MRTVLIAILTSTAALLSTRASAEETRFVCGTEEATDAIAQKMVSDDQGATETIAPFVEQGVCTILPVQVHVDVVYHGKAYTRSDFQVEVVGFMDGGNTHMMYGLRAKHLQSI